MGVHVRRNTHYIGANILKLPATVGSFSKERLHHEAQELLEELIPQLGISKARDYLPVNFKKPKKIFLRPVEPWEIVVDEPIAVFADGDVNISGISDSLIVATGNVTIGHSSGNIIVASGNVEVSHDGNGEGARGSLILTPGKADIEHAYGTIVYAPLDLYVGFPHNVYSFNSMNVRVKDGHLEHKNIAELFNPYEKITGEKLAAVGKVIPEPFALNHKGKVSVDGGNIYSVQSDGSVLLYGRGNMYYEIRPEVAKRYSITKLPGLTDIVKINVTYHKLLAIDTEGCLWAMGVNKYGTLGFQGQQEVPRLTRFDQFCDIIDFDSTFSSTILLTENNKAYFWGEAAPENLQGNPISFREPIKSVHAFSGFFAISESGRVYAWGDSGRNRLFNGERRNWSLRPQKLDIPCKVTSLSLSLSLMFVCQSGNVYVTGYNNNASLGIGHMRNVEGFIKHPYLRNVEKIAGSVRRIAKTKNNRYFGWGDQMSGPVEIKGGELETPIEIDVPSNTVDVVSRSRTFIFLMEHGRAAILIPEEHWLFPVKFTLEDYHFKYFKTEQ